MLGFGRFRERRFKIYFETLFATATSSREQRSSQSRQNDAMGQP